MRFILALLIMIGTAQAHDSWISRGAGKNPAGEWCCGPADCGLLDKDAVVAKSNGYHVHGFVTYGPEVSGSDDYGPTRRERVDEVVPYSQAQPSPDGAYWRCKRPDETMRCFFAPPPGS